MTLRITPLRKALANTGAIKLPGNPFLGGIVSIFLCAIFGGFAVMLWASVNGAYYAPTLYQVTLTGAYFSVIFAALIHLMILISAFVDRDGFAVKGLFVVGGIVSVVLFILLTTISYPFVISWLEQVGNIRGEY